MEDSAKRLSVAAALRGLGLGANLVDVAELLWEGARREREHKAVAFNAVLRHALGKNERCIRRWIEDLDARGVITISRRERNDGAYYYSMRDPVERYEDHRSQQEAEEQTALGEAPSPTLKLHVGPDILSGPNVRTHSEIQPSLPNFDTARDVRRAGSRGRKQETSSIEELEQASSSSSLNPFLSFPPEAQAWVRALAAQLVRDVNELVPERPGDGEPIDPRPNAYGRLHAGVAERFATTVWQWATQERSVAKARGEELLTRFRDPLELRRWIDQQRGAWRAKLKNALAVPGMVQKGAVLYWFGIVEAEFLEPHRIEFRFARSRDPPSTR